MTPKHEMEVIRYVHNSALDFDLDLDLGRCFGMMSNSNLDSSYSNMGSTSNFYVLFNLT